MILIDLLIGPHYNKILKLKINKKAKKDINQNMEMIVILIFNKNHLSKLIKIFGKII